MRVELRLTGISPLVMHNIRLADKHDEITMAIAELTDKKRNRTEADDREIERLEFLGGLYHEPGIGVFVPTANVVRCLENAAKITRQGAGLVRAVAVVTDKAPLVYQGPREPLKLWEQPEFRWRTQVGVQRGKVTRVRPIFRQWGLATEVELVEELFDRRDFERIAETAGRSEGLCDARKLGYGRFVVETAVVA